MIRQLFIAACTSVVTLSFCFQAGALNGLVVADGGLNLRSGASITASRLSVIPNGAQVTVLGTEGDWYSVSYAGVQGFVSKQYVQLQETGAEGSSQSQAGVVIAEPSLRLRATASTSGNILDSMPTGAKVMVLENQNGWMKVRYNGKDGYCSSEYIRLEDSISGGGESVPTQPETPQTQVQTGIVSANGGLRLRAEANTNGQIVATMPQYSVIKVLSQSNGWMKVEYNGKTGYCSAEYVTIQSGETSSGTSGTAMVNAEGGLCLRKEASTSSQKLSVVPNGAMIQVSAVQNGWCKTTYNGVTGYVSADYLLFSGSEQAKTKGEEAVALAKQFLGVPYVYGGSSPNGFDCSGLIYYVYKQLGVTLNRSSAAQFSNGTAVDRDSLLPGDLVFFYNKGTSTIGHVGMYVGNDQFIHAPQPGDVVKIVSLDSANYPQRYAGAKRIFN
ncbi:MAG: SH3 domain-containing protein [Eubacteriales bacterium]